MCIPLLFTCERRPTTNFRGGVDYNNIWTGTKSPHTKIYTLYRLAMVYLGWCLRSESVQTSKQLYKYLMRECKKLPQESQNYYRHFLRQVLCRDELMKASLF